MKVQVRVQIVQETREVMGEAITARLPVYATGGAAGADVHAFCPGVRHIIKPDEVGMIPTGLKLKIPESMGLFILPRSGTSRKKIKVANSPGLLDSDFRGELMILLHNETSEDFIINHDDRIAQLVIGPVNHAQFEVMDSLDETARGEGGFGSTGVVAL